MGNRHAVYMVMTREVGRRGDVEYVIACTCEAEAHWRPTMAAAVDAHVDHVLGTVAGV